LVLGLMRAQAAAGSAVIVASHDPVAVEYADVVLSMRDGKLVVAP
jgi:ABC-type lipoprotein export system ATPase subunit